MTISYKVGRACVVRGRPVGVVAERSAARGVSRALRPGVLVLAEGRIGRTHERRDRESSRSRLLQRREARPHGVVERSLNVARHDRVPFSAHVRRLYRHPYVVLAVAAGVPRLAALLYERGRILEAYTDKSDDFALTFLDSGTYGFIPGIPSAYTQPLYGFFLIPIYWVERSWTTVGAAQIAVAIVTAWIVFAIGRRVASDGVAMGGALLATLHPYLVWHDIHLNREVLDGLLAAAIVLTALVAAERERSLWWAAALGGTLGLAILGNARLLLLPLVLGIWLMARLGFAQHGLAALLVVCSCAALVLAPWVVRNRQSVGCLAITTDSRALWKANNLNTYDVLARGGWIDDVPPFPGSPPSPQDAGEIYRQTGRIVRVDECEQMRFFREQVVEFWREHPGEKARLAGQAARLLWQPNVLETEGRPGAGTWRDTARSTVEPIFMIVALRLRGRRSVRSPPELRRARRHPPRVSDRHRDALRRRDEIPSAVGLPRRDPGRSGNRSRRGALASAPLLAGERALVERLDALDAPLGRELRERTLAARAAHLGGTREISGELDDRVRQGFRLR